MALWHVLEPTGHLIVFVVWPDPGIACTLQKSLPGEGAGIGLQLLCKGQTDHHKNQLVMRLLHCGCTHRRAACSNIIFVIAIRIAKLADLRRHTRPHVLALMKFRHACVPGQTTRHCHQPACVVKCIAGEWIFRTRLRPCLRRVSVM